MISTKGRYALRMLVDLAHEDAGSAHPIPLREVAERQGISEKYLQRIAKGLVEAGLLVGSSGKGGGYWPARAADEMPVSEVLEAAEGTLAPVACLVPGAPPCEHAPHCKTLAMWEGFSAVSREYFGSITVADLAADAHEHANC